MPAPPRGWAGRCAARSSPHGSRAAGPRRAGWSSAAGRVRRAGALTASRIRRCSSSRTSTAPPSTPRTGRPWLTTMSVRSSRLSAPTSSRETSASRARRSAARRSAPRTTSSASRTVRSASTALSRATCHDAARASTARISSCLVLQSRRAVSMTQKEPRTAPSASVTGQPAQPPMPSASTDGLSLVRGCVPASCTWNGARSATTYWQNDPSTAISRPAEVSTPAQDRKNERWSSTRVMTPSARRAAARRGRSARRRTLARPRRAARWPRRRAAGRGRARPPPRAGPAARGPGTRVHDALPAVRRRGFGAIAAARAALTPPVGDDGDGQRRRRPRPSRRPYDRRHDRAPVGVRRADRARVRAGRRRAGSRRAARRSGRLPLHPRRVPLDVHRPALDDAPVRRVSAMRRSLPTNVTATCVAARYDAD